MKIRSSMSERRQLDLELSAASPSQDKHKNAKQSSSSSVSSLSTTSKVRLFIILLSSLIALTSNTSLLRWPAIDFTQASETNNSTNKQLAQTTSGRQLELKQASTSPAAAATAVSDQPVQNQPQQQATFRLDCQPGEQRQFSYESSTKVWGSSNQQVRLRATLRLRCMEPPTNTTLKYLAEIVSLEPNFIADLQQQQQPEQQSSRLKTAQIGPSSIKNASPRMGKSGSQRAADFNKRQQLMADDLYWAGGQPQVARAEPVFEEVGEVASRVKRSVSAWFSKAWVSVKDFFGNIFTSSERTTISREQAFKESGLDIAGQCKAPSGGSSSKGKGGSNGLPFDESVFDDLGPEYYVGASSLDGATAYEFSGPSGSSLFGLDRATGSSGDDDETDVSLSFFDDPQPAKVRTRRASSSSSKQARSRGQFGNDQNNEDHGRLLRMPFVFLQSRTGKIIEVRFSGDETNLSVKNFKRHLCDLFATNLDANKATATNEVSPIGKHQTKYTVDSSANSIDSMKQSVIKSASTGGASEGHDASHQQLVRVLAMVGTTSGGNRNANSGGSQGDQHKYDDDDDSGADGEVGNELGSAKKQAALGDEGNVSVLRTINTTSSIQASSSMLAPNIDRMEVRVKQVQQINEGRLIGTAGQMSMSLVQPQSQSQAQQQVPGDRSGSSSRRTKRNSNEDNEQMPPDSERQSAQIEDIADLLQVSTSFSLQLVPISRNPDGSINDSKDNDDSSSSAPKSRSLHRSGRSTPEVDNNSTTAATTSIIKSSNGTITATNSLPSEQSGSRKGNSTASTTKRVKRRRQAPQLVKSAPTDSLELQRVLQEWRKQEARLQLSATNLIAENSGQQESDMQRLDILRDQIRMRLNEEFVRNRIRRSLTGGQQEALTVAASRQKVTGARDGGGDTGSDKRPTASSGGDLGLGLTQLVLGNGVTVKRKGPIYSTIEEVMELEADLANDQSELAISRLMRDTIRMDKLRDHCTSSVPSLDELHEAHKKRPRQSASSDQLVDGGVVERTLPFGFKLDEQSSGHDDHGRQTAPNPSGQRTGKSSGGGTSKRPPWVARASEFERKNDRKFEQCRNVLQLMLKLNDKQATNLVLELVDECNQRLLMAAKSEELGYGPVGKYYRRMRQQLIELLPHLSRPSDLLIDKLLARLYYPKLDGDAQRRQQQHKPSTSRPRELPEFEYINTSRPKQATVGESDTAKYNKSLLKEEDDFNNNDGAALLVMTLTSLAAKGSVSRAKRVELADKLLQSLKGTSCSLFNSPDLDIIESLANFQEPLDEIVGRLIGLARRCKQYDQYVIACIHGLSGQLNNAASQRFLTDQLKSSSSSCSIKSEIVLTLIGAQLINDLNKRPAGPGLQSNAANSTASMLWPSYGINRLDETLLDLIESSDKQREPDRRCLKHLIVHYFSRKHNMQASDAPSAGRSSVVQSPSMARRHRRAVVNENNFWDESQCKRWTMPADLSSGSPLPNDLASVLTGRNQSLLFNSPYDDSGELVDEIDDNSIVTALLNQQQQRQKASRTLRGRTQRLVERELEQSANGSSLNKSSLQSGTAGNQAGDNSTGNYLRRRHKCMASKSFGPKNAQAQLKAEIVNDLIGSKDENKFLARFRLSTDFLGNRIDVGRMYLWHQRRTTRAYANILGRSIWDTSHGCKDKAPSQTLYMPLFDFNLWLVKVSVGLRLSAEMGFFSNCLGDDNDAIQKRPQPETSLGGTNGTSARTRWTNYVRMEQQAGNNGNDELQLYPTISLKAAGEATAKLVVARTGMSLASQYSYQGSIQVSRQPESCMSIYSSHQPMNITFSSWFQLWDNDCHFWGSRNKAEPRATKWRLNGRKPIAWLEDECLSSAAGPEPTTTTPVSATRLNSTVS